MKFLISLQMAESEPQEGNHDNMVKVVEDVNGGLEKLLEEMEKLTGTGLILRIIWICLLE